MHKSKIICSVAYIRHFIFAGCYDNDPWYLVTNFAGHLDLAGFYFFKCPANSKPPAFLSCDGGSLSLNILFLPGLEHAPPPDMKLMLHTSPQSAALSISSNSPLR
jgi:hypothetical protein